ncbi:MAG: outer membrane protein assembly factor BamD, partial [Myxococcales bacterium]|nr:outer membrane protein assembly factor BamD [Myxococcales bacterium]
VAPEAHEAKPAPADADAPHIAPSAAPKLHPSASSAAATADSDFEVAMRAFRGGSWSQAAQLFAAFEAQHPNSRRSEDAAYLRVVALQRSGQSAQMQAAARTYLARYPNGFRAKEVQALSASK